MRARQTRTTLVAALALMALAQSCSPRTTAPRATATTTPAAAAASAGSAAPAASAPSASATPACALPPTVTPTPDPNAHVDGSVGTPVSLDAAALFGVARAAGTTYRWEQLFADQSATDYVTNQPAALAGAAAAVASFRPAAPGNYRFRLTVTTGGAAASHVVDAWVTLPGPTLAVRAVGFPDVFETLGNPPFTLNRPDPACRRQVLDLAMAGAVRDGANWAQIAPSLFYTQLRPVPVIEPLNNDLSLTDDAYYADLVAAMQRAGLKVAQVMQVSPGFDLPAADVAAMDDLKQDPAWWDAWFTSYGQAVIAEAARAERNGVDMFDLLIWTDSTFVPDVYPQYEQRWRDIIAKVRAVYHGKVAIEVSNTLPRHLVLADAVDVVIVGSASGFLQKYEVDGRRVVTDPQHPTLAQLTAAARGMFAESKPNLPPGVEVYWTTSANSADGQEASEDTSVIPTLQRDFNEQVLYYEAFFTALAENPWVHGAFVERLDWFDQYRRPADQLYWDETIGGSPRGKPAEDVVRLWFGVR